MWYRLLRMAAIRFLLGLLTLLCISAVIFVAVGLLPGDFASEILGQSATPEATQQLRHALGLDQSLPVRYGQWLLGLLRGDFGRSFASGDAAPRTVVDVISHRLLNTLFLSGLTALISVPLAVGLGIIAALKRNSYLDRILNSVTLTTISCPEFFMAYLLMLFLGVKLRLFYTLSNISGSMGTVETLERVALPVLTLTLVILAHMMRMTRSALIGTMNNPYIEMARCKGLSPTRIMLRHALPNAWAPIVNVIAFNLSYLVVGVVVVETVFVYPGIGQTMVDAVRTRDIPVVQACALIFAATYILLNLVADLIATATNPKLMHPR